ncbi:MAG: hypothetical protein J6T51_05950 [Kiritimatiellae bacterium]|nr:hypothetical protein [Kiritimatiellia bacterium]
MNVTDVKRLIESGETEVVEFKRGRGGVPGSLWESYSDGVKNSRKKTSTKNVKTREKKTREKDFGLPPEEVVVLRLRGNK